MGEGAVARHTFSEFTNEDPGPQVSWPFAAATLWVVDRFGRVDSESIPIPLLHVVMTDPNVDGYFNWGYLNNPLPGYEWNVRFDRRSGDTVTGSIGWFIPGLVRFVATFTGERELLLRMENGDEYTARFEWDPSGRFNHWGVPLRNLMTLTQTKGAHVGVQWLLVRDSYA